MHACYVWGIAIVCSHQLVVCHCLNWRCTYCTINITYNARKNVWHSRFGSLRIVSFGTLRCWVCLAVTSRIGVPVCPCTTICNACMLCGPPGAVSSQFKKSSNQPAPPASWLNNRSISDPTIHTYILFAYYCHPNCN